MKSLREMMDIVEGKVVEGMAESGDDELAKLKKKYQLYSKSDLAPAQKEEVLRRIRKEIELINSNQGVAEEATPKAVEQINKLYQDKQL